MRLFSTYVSCYKDKPEFVTQNNILFYFITSSHCITLIIELSFLHLSNSSMSWLQELLILLALIWRFTHCKTVVLNLCDQHICDTRPHTRPCKLLLRDHFFLSTYTTCGKTSLRVLSQRGQIRLFLLGWISGAAQEISMDSQAAKITLPNHRQQPRHLWLKIRVKTKMLTFSFEN